MTVWIMVFYITFETIVDLGPFVYYPRKAYPDSLKDECHQVADRLNARSADNVRFRCMPMTFLSSGGGDETAQ